MFFFSLKYRPNIRRVTVLTVSFLPVLYKGVCQKSMCIAQPAIEWSEICLVIIIIIIIIMFIKQS